MPLLKDQHNTYARVFKAAQLRPLCKLILLAVLPTFGTISTAQTQANNFVNYDGSAAADLESAAANWAANAEFAKDWGLAAMNAHYAYAQGLSGKGVKLGAVDSGLLMTHQEFSNRGVVALDVSGTYLNDGSTRENGLGATWKAGQTFNVPGQYNSTFNDDHGTHVSGTIAAAKDGVGMMGVAFNSNYYTTNTHSNDGAIYSSNMDYNYFYQAYGNLAKAGVQVTNSSWGSPGSTIDTSTLDKLVEGYLLAFVTSGKKTWLDAAADVTQEYPVIQVFAGGNNGDSYNSNLRSLLPYFRPEIEDRWLAVASVERASGKLNRSYFSNGCGVSKYWCVSAPGSAIYSTVTTSNTSYGSKNGTSMAAPHATGALGVLIERYPSLSPEAIRVILMTTAKPLGSGPADLPDRILGWGVPDLKKALNGPSQLLGQLEAHIAKGEEDTWSNDISEVALLQRKAEERTEVSDWPATKAKLLQEIGDTNTWSDVENGIAKALPHLELAIKYDTRADYDSEKLDEEIAILNSDKNGKALLVAYRAKVGYFPHPTKYSQATAYADFINGRTNAEVATSAHDSYIAFVTASNKKINDIVTLRQKRVDFLSTKSDTAYQGRLSKTGGGILTLSGTNKYTGGVIINAGTIKTGKIDALAQTSVNIASGATLDLTTSGDAAIASLSAQGMVFMADGIPGQILTVNGAWNGVNAKLALDILPEGASNNPTAKRAIAKAAPGVVSDKIVINGPVSGTTKLSLQGISQIDPALLTGGLSIIQSTQPLNASNFTLENVPATNGYTYSLRLATDGTLEVITAKAPPVQPGETTAVPSMSTAGLGLLAVLLGSVAGFLSRRKTLNKQP